MLIHTYVSQLVCYLEMSNLNFVYPNHLHAASIFVFSSSLPSFFPSKNGLICLFWCQFNASVFSSSIFNYSSKFGKSINFQIPHLFSCFAIQLWAIYSPRTQSLTFLYYYNSEMEMFFAVLFTRARYKISRL